MWYLYQVNLNFQRVSRLFVLSFENNAHQTSWTRYFNCRILTVDIKDNEVMIDGQNVFDQRVRNDLRTNGNIKKIAIDQGDHYTGCFLYHLYGELKSNEKSNFMETLHWPGHVAMFFFIEEERENILDFPQGTMKVLVNLFYFNVIWNDSI